MPREKLKKNGFATFATSSESQPIKKKKMQQFGIGC